jgi:hypothetical protein
MNTAMISGVDQPDGFMDNDTASVTLNMAAVTSAVIELDAGWNQVSLPLIPDVDAVVTFFSGIESDLNIVWRYDASDPVPADRWASYIPSGPPPGFTTVDPQWGYWIFMDDAATLSFTGVELKSGAELPPSYAVSIGWNLIGFKSTTPMAAGEYLNAIEGQWTRIYGFANGSYAALQAGGMMMPGYGYWLAVNAAGTIYP